MLRLPEQDPRKRRQQLADLIAAQTPSPCEAEAQALERLRDPRTPVLITGQQCGLLLGPALVLYKTIDLFRIAQSLPDKALCLFWMESNDHDWAEAARLQLPGRRIAFEQEKESKGRSIGHIPFSASFRTELLEQTKTHLAPLCKDKYEVLAEVLQGADGFVSQFRGYMRMLFAAHGLLLLDPSTQAARELAIPFWQHLQAHQQELKEALVSRSRELKSKQGQVQVEVDERADFFMEDEQGRRRRPQLDESPGDPLRITPNVLSRPLLQDWLCDTHLTVLGPAERAYQSQLDQAYALFGIKAPTRMPRSHLQLLLKDDQQLLARYGIALDEPPRPGHSWQPELLAQFPAAERGLRDQARLDELARELEELSHARSAEFHRPDLDGQGEKVARQIRQLAERVQQAGQQQHKGELRELQDCGAWLHHREHPQERNLNAIALLCRMGGLKLVDSLLASLPPIPAATGSSPYHARITLQDNKPCITQLE